MDCKSKIHFTQPNIGTLPNDWGIVLLRDVSLKIGSGITPRGGESVYKTKGTALIRSQNVLNNCFGTDGLAYIGEDIAKDMENVTVAEKDVLLNITGDSVARCCTAPDYVLPARVNQHVSIIRTDDQKLDPIFLRYYLTSPRMQDYMLGLAQSGGTRNALTKGMIESFAIPQPPIEEQKAIAKILSKLELRIVLNKQTIKTLEAIGEAVFKRWFVDFEFPNQEGKPYKSSGGEMAILELGERPKTWKNGTLSQIAVLMMGISPNGESYNTEGIGVPLLNGAADYQDNIILPRKWTTEPIKICKKGNLLFCIRATIGNLVFSDKEYCLGRGLAGMSAKNINFTEFVYFTLQRSLEDLISKASGSVILGLSKTDLDELPVIIPDDSTINKFHEICFLLFRKIENLKQNSSTLTLIRDSLLPKLMSGKIRVLVEKQGA